MDDDESIRVSPGRAQLKSPTSSSPSEKENRSADTGLELAKSRPRRLQPDDWTRLPAVTDDLSGDLFNIGFSPNEVNNMLDQPQSFHDLWKHPWKDKPSKEYKLQQERLESEEKERETTRRKLISKYQPLVLEQGSDWELFDPEHHSYPLARGEDAPPIFKRYELFAPGNARIVEYHSNKQKVTSIRLRSTPGSLRGKWIKYATTGPEILREGSDKEEAIEKASLPPAAQPTAPPTAPQQPAKRRPGRPRKTAAPEFTSVHGRAKPAPKKPSGRPKGRPRKEVVKPEPMEDSGSELSDFNEM